MAAKRRLPLSDAQLEVMDVVWTHGSATVADVWEALSTRRPIARNTVQTTLVRLEEKGWLRHTEEGRTYRYKPVRGRDRALRGMVSRLVKTAFHGSAEGLVAALLDGRGVSADEARRIKALLDEAERSDA